MQWHDFVFSGQWRFRRHLAFWLVWVLYIVFTIFFTFEIAAGVFYHHQPGLSKLGYLMYLLLVLIMSVLLLFTHMIFCYGVLHLIQLDYLSKRNYLHLLGGVFLLCVLNITLGYFLYTVVYPSINRLFRLRLTEVNQVMLWTSISACLIGSVKVTLVAFAVTLLKRWWLKQKEKEQLERERIIAELQLLKGQIHPDFLFGTLTSIIAHAQAGSPAAPEMLIKLSDLLSYMLYECDVPEVSLEKEVSMVKDYMALEKTRYGERLEMTVQINGSAAGQMISPLILLPFIENSLAYCDKERVEQAWINLDLTVHGNHLSMKLFNGLPAGIFGGETGDEQRLANVQKRLVLLYPGRHELKINAEQELLMVHFNLTLDGLAQTNQTAAG